MFQSLLARLVARAGARWAMIVGTDGVLLETDSRSFHTEAEGLAAEYATLYRAARKVAGDTDLGGFHNSLMVTDQGKILLQALASEYFLVLFLEPESPAGKAAFEVARASTSLAQELVY